METKKESKNGLIISTILVILIAGLVIWYMNPWGSEVEVVATEESSEVAAE